MQKIDLRLFDQQVILINFLDEIIDFFRHSVEGGTQLIELHIFVGRHPCVVITFLYRAIYSSADKQELGSIVSPAVYVLKDNAEVSEVKINQESYLAVSRSIGTTGLTFIAGIPKKQVLSKLSESMRNYIWIIALIAFISLAAGVLLSLRFTRVIRDLLRSIRNQ
ncbi:hypothetical protein NSS79_27300 [Paenibacillus sp. FSL L8-0436]|uniref:hypothetical protein n=1 Tax=Paenibacillus sp. FSL L8-0436 TaxID=2954686 RepID=UPI0031584CFF